MIENGFTINPTDYEIVQEWLRTRTSDDRAIYAAATDRFVGLIAAVADVWAQEGNWPPHWAACLAGAVTAASENDDVWAVAHLAAIGGYLVALTNPGGIL